MPQKSSRRNKFRSRKLGPFLPGKLAQSQALQRQYAIRRGCRATHLKKDSGRSGEPLDMAYEYLDKFPSLSQDSDLQRMKADAENRSIDSKEEVSREMCSMLVDKAQNWQKTIAHVAKDLPGDLDNLNPLSFLKPLVHYSVGGVVESMGALQSSGGNGGGADSTLIGSGSEESGHRRTQVTDIVVVSESPSRYILRRKSASAEITVKTAAEIANPSVISGKASRDADTSMAESVPGMTNVLQAIDSYEVAHSPDRDKKSPAALEGVSSSTTLIMK